MEGAQKETVPFNLHHDNLINYSSYNGRHSSLPLSMWPERSLITMAIIESHCPASLKPLRIDASNFHYTLHQTMHSRDQNSTVSKLFCNVEQQRYGISTHSITALYSKPKTHVDNLGCMKIAAIRGPGEKEKGRAKRTRSSTVLEIPGEEDSSKRSSTFEEDFDSMSDAESSCHHQGLDVVDTALNDEERNIDELFYHEEARKKLKLLADMVGADTKEPGFVLAKVVTVLKSLRNGSGHIHLPRK